jgi:thymidine phosphorylase
VIIAKRDGEKLPPDAIRWFIDSYTRGSIADEQAAALCMAIYLNGLDGDELSVWTTAMIDSGETVDLGAVRRPTVDKHSTGGVGDKISLILCPLMAACGAAMPQVSGRGLGHTGGTLDKMASIPGWEAELTPDRFQLALEKIGAVITAASDNLAPADRKLYALRDVTGTVASIPLIASSIMSKKIASGTSSLVLDVKVGRGAFMTELSDARELAETMVGIGTAAGIETVALLTRMDWPLGRMVGNSLEVDESVEVLAGGGPADVRAVTLALASEMVTIAGLEVDPAAVLDSGAAAKAFDAMVRFQGGDLAAPRATAGHHHTIRATTDGYVTDIDALTVGQAAVRLGAGRARKEDTISNGAGIECAAKPGDPVVAGQPVLVLHADDPASITSTIERLTDAITIGPEPPPLPDPIIDRIAP